MCRLYGTRRREGLAIANEAQGFSNLPHNLTTLSYERLHSSEKGILFSLLKIPRKASVQSGKNIKLSCTSCTWAIDFARDAKCSYKSHRTQDIKHFLISSKTNPYSRADYPPASPSATYFKGITYLFRSCVARS